MQNNLFEDQSLEQIAAEKKTWEAEAGVAPGAPSAAPDIPGAAPGTPVAKRTHSGLGVDPLYTPADIPDFQYQRDLGFPGRPPYSRGIYPLMYREQPWTFRQLAGYGSAEETNERYRFLIANGATGINGVFDYPTLRGFNSDHPAAEGDVGQGGVAIDSVEDMHLLFKDIPIDQISVSLVVCNPIMAVSVFAMYLAMARERGIPWEKLRGTNQNDFLMETVVTTAPNILQPSFSFKLSTDIVEFCTREVPGWHPISYTGYNYRESGVSAVQEVAMVMAHAAATIEEMLQRGYHVDDFAPRLSFFFSADSDLFEEIAKYRAARRIWYKMISGKYGAKKVKSQVLRYHVQTSGASLTAQQPLNNVTRSAFQALAAVLGGAQSLHVNAFDEALAIPTEEAAIVALRTQQIILHETNAANTIDPLGGSYFIEHLTDELERRIYAYIDDIQQQGGIVAAVENGWLQNEIARAAHEHYMDVEAGRRKVVGVNCFRSEKEPEIEIFRAPDMRARLVERIKKVKAARDPAAAANSLQQVQQTCQQGGNVFPAVLDAVQNRVTLGEISDIFRDHQGGWRLAL